MSSKKQIKESIQLLRLVIKYYDEIGSYFMEVEEILDSANICKFIGNKMIGFILGDSYREEHSVIKSIYILPEYRKKGYASDLLREWIDEYGVKDLMLEKAPLWMHKIVSNIVKEIYIPNQSPMEA